MPVENANSPKTLGELDPKKGCVVELNYRKPHRFDKLTVHKIKEANGQKYFIGPSEEKLRRQDYVKKKIKPKFRPRKQRKNKNRYERKIWVLQTVASVTGSTKLVEQSGKKGKGPFSLF